MKSATIRPHIVRTPIEVSLRLEPSNGIPTTQSFDFLDGGYYPDYGVTYLQVTPRISVQHRDDASISEALNAEGLTDDNTQSLQWLCSAGGEPTPIVSGQDGFSFPQGTDPDGNEIPKNTLRIASNTPINQPRTLICRLDYLYNGTKYRVEATLRLQAVNEGDGMPILESDIPTNGSYNPVRDTDKLVINLSMRTKAAEMDAADWEVSEWQKQMTDINGQHYWRRIETHLGVDQDGEPLENADDAEFANEGKKMTIDRTLMDEDCIFRVLTRFRGKDGIWYGHQAPDPDDPTITQDNGMIPTIYFHYRRKMPKLKVDIKGSSIFVAEDVEQLHYEAVVADSQGVIENPAERFLKATWYAFQGDQQGNADWQKIGEGFYITIPTSDIVDKDWGGGIMVDVEDRGPLSVLTDNTGAILTDDSGNWLVG